MNNVFYFIIFFTINSISLILTSVNAAEKNYKQGYITDQLSTFIHSGPSTNYRILGTVTAGSSIKITGLQENNYSEIIDDKSRKAWIETKYITKGPVLRISLAKLNKKISSNNSYTTELDGQINTLTSKVNTLLSEKQKLTDELQSVSKKLSQTSLKIKDQDTNIKKQWFFTGAMVLGIGLILGLILPRLFSRKRNTMQSWS
jgi:SH3 domain protein